MGVGSWQFGATGFGVSARWERRSHAPRQRTSHPGCGALPSGLGVTKGGKCPKSANFPGVVEHYPHRLPLIPNQGPQVPLLTLRGYSPADQREEGGLPEFGSGARRGGRWEGVSGPMTKTTGLGCPTLAAVSTELSFPL